MKTYQLYFNLTHPHHSHHHHRRSKNLSRPLSLFKKLHHPPLSPPFSIHPSSSSFSCLCLSLFLEMYATFTRLGVRIDPRWMTLKFLKSLLFHAKIILVSSLAHLGLIKSRQRERAEGDQEPHSPDQYNNTVLVMDGSTPALFPVYILASRFKDKVPVLEFGELLAKRRALHGDGGEGRGGGDQCLEKMCTVCLSGIEGRHEVRELLNCSHVFHRECLDRWVEENQVTCPLCRCLLFPAATPRRRRIAEACD